VSRHGMRTRDGCGSGEAQMSTEGARREIPLNLSGKRTE
jgi:hypothetical protein